MVIGNSTYNIEVVCYAVKFYFATKYKINVEVETYYSPPAMTHTVSIKVPLPQGNFQLVTQTATTQELEEERFTLSDETLATVQLLLG
jgi:hypothetical protein